MSHADRVPDGFAARGTDACSKITSHAERCEARDGFGGRTRNRCGARRMARVQNSYSAPRESNSATLYIYIYIYIYIYMIWKM
jgi:hypothetical protein